MHRWFKMIGKQRDMQMLAVPEGLSIDALVNKVSENMR